MEKKQNDQDMTVLESSVIIMVISMINFGILGAYYTPFGFWKSVLVLGIGGGMIFSLVNWLLNCYIAKNKDKDLMLTLLSILLISMIVLGVFGAIGSIGFIKGASTNGLIVGIILCILIVGGYFIDCFESASEKKPSGSGDKKLYDHVPDFAYEAAKTIKNQRIGLLALLPSFTDMEKDATAEEVMRVAALADTILNLTFKNPFPIDQDPVFSGVLRANNEWAKGLLEEGQYKIEAHEELKESFEERYSATTAKQMMEIDYWNQRMIEHAVLTRTLGPKPAYQCLLAALNLSSFAREASAVLIVNYAHLLLKSTTLPKQNPALIDDITKVLKQASSYLHFDEGMKYEPKAMLMEDVSNGASTKTDNIAETKEPTSMAENGEKLMRPKFTKEETLALGTMALSFIVVNGKPDAKAEPVIINELEGFTVEDVKQMYKNLMKDQGRLLMLLHKSCMYDPFKKMYAAGFLAKVIQSRSDGGKAPLVAAGWEKVVRNIIGLSGKDVAETQEAVKLYDKFEHPQIDPKTLFLILSWLSQAQYKQNDEPSERTSGKEVLSYSEKTTFTVDGKVSFTMIRVDGGTFTMGGFEEDEDAYAHERPRHEVVVSTFLIGETQVTQELWEAVMGSNPSEFKGTNKPVEMISWNDCQTFIKKLNEKTGQKFRLPTEAEWEYAARGGQQSKGYTFSGSNDRNEVAWHPGNRGSETTHDVKTKLPNELGIYDMSGNVLEWVNDWFGKYPSEKTTDPSGPSSGVYKVLRGGSWRNPSSFCRVSFRNYMEPGSENFMYGLRIAL